MKLQISIIGAKRIQDEIQEKIDFALSEVAAGRTSLEKASVIIELPDIGHGEWRNENNG